MICTYYNIIMYFYLFPIITLASSSTTESWRTGTTLNFKDPVEHYKSKFRGSLAWLTSWINYLLAPKIKEKTSINGLEVTEMMKRKRRIKIGPFQNSYCSKLVCCFCGMYSIPANILVWITTSWCCYSASINHSGISTVSFRIKIVLASPMATACFGTIFEPYSKTNNFYQMFKQISDLLIYCQVC